MYLWHGYHQYGARAIAERFDPNDSAIYMLRKLGRFLVHWSLVTLLAYLLRASFRSNWPRAYDRLLRVDLSMDRTAPCKGSIYAILQPANPPSQEQRSRS